VPCLPVVACVFSGLAMKKNWQNHRRAAGLPHDRPNLVMSYSVQVCTGCITHSGYGAIHDRGL